MLVWPLPNCGWFSQNPEIAPPFRNPAQRNGSIPQRRYQQTLWFQSWFQSGANTFRPSTVGPFWLIWFRFIKSMVLVLVDCFFLVDLFELVQKIEGPGFPALNFQGYDSKITNLCFQLSLLCFLLLQFQTSMGPLLQNLGASIVG